MFENLCSNCNHKNCCTDSAVPLVFANDLKKIMNEDPEYIKNIKTINVNGKQVNALKKKETSTECTYWNEKTGQCRIYNARPIDCRLYPFDIIQINNAYYWIVYSCNKDSDWKWSENHLTTLENDESFKHLMNDFDVFSDHTKMVLPNESEKTPYVILRKVVWNKLES